MWALEVVGLPIHIIGSTRPRLRTTPHRQPVRRCRALHLASIPGSGRRSTDPLRSRQPASHSGQKFCSWFGTMDCTFEISLLIMFRIVSRRSLEHDSHTSRVPKIPMRPFTSPIHKPMLFQIRDELPNLARHIKLPSKKQLQSNVKFSKSVATIALELGQGEPRTNGTRITDKTSSSNFRKH
jgi:hypothetical protein